MAVRIYEGTMAGILGATITEGPHKGLALGEAMLIGNTVACDGEMVVTDRPFLLRKRIERNEAAIARLQEENRKVAAELAAEKAS